VPRKQECCTVHLQACRAAGAVQPVPALGSNGAAARRKAANASSVTFTADVGADHRVVKVLQPETGLIM